MVKEGEDPRLGASRPLREDNRPTTSRSELAKQSRHILGGIFAVAIHDDDGRTGGFRFGEAESHGDGTLMAEIPAQFQNVNMGDPLECPGAKFIRRRRSRSIVDQQHPESPVELNQGSIELLQKLRHSLPVVEDGNQD
jgi:hypothetical protein